MPVIKVWGLPKMEEGEYARLEWYLRASARGIPELGIKTDKQVTVFFPSDMRRDISGDEIIIEVTELFVKPERTEEVRKALVEGVAVATGMCVPSANLIECVINPFEQSQGYAEIKRNRTKINVRVTTSKDGDGLEFIVNALQFVPKLSAEALLGNQTVCYFNFRRQGEVPVHCQIDWQDSMSQGGGSAKFGRVPDSPNAQVLLAKDLKYNDQMDFYFDGDLVAFVQAMSQ